MTRRRVEMVAVFAYAALALVLFLLPIPFPPHGGRWWIWWATTALCLAMAVAVIVFPSREHPTLAGVQVVVVAAGNGCAAVPAVVRDRCRSADLTGSDVAAQLTALVAQVRGAPGQNGSGT